MVSKKISIMLIAGFFESDKLIYLKKVPVTLFRRLKGTVA
jgi:hypothetical protein